MIAAGLILTLVVGGLAVAIGLTGPSVSSAVPRARRAAVEPMVRTVRRTVTVHKTGDHATGTVVQLASSSASAAPSSSNDDDHGEIEDHDADDRGHEDDARDDDRDDHGESEHDGHEGEPEDD
jgi:hypothetical protein